MKKTLLFTLLAVLVLTLALTACGSSTPTTTQKNTTTIDTTANKNPSENPGSSTVGVTNSTPVSTTESPLVTAYNNPEKYVTLPTLSDIKVSMQPIKKDVDTYLAQVLTSVGREDYKTLDANATAILGDNANITYTGRAKDSSVKLSEETISGMTNASSAAGYNLVLGSGSFIPGFEEQLIGKNIGDTIGNVIFQKHSQPEPPSILAAS